MRPECSHHECEHETADAAARVEVDTLRAKIEALAVAVENRMMATAKPAEIRALLDAAVSRHPAGQGRQR